MTSSRSSTFSALSPTPGSAVTGRSSDDEGGLRVGAFADMTQWCSTPHHRGMNATPPLTAAVSITFFVVSIVPVGAILVYRGASGAVAAARAALLANVRAAVVIAALYEIASIIRGRPLDVTTAAVFSWVLVGLALARSIPGFEPLAVTRDVREHRHPVRSVVVMLGLALVLRVVSSVAGGAGMSLGHLLAGETSRTADVAATFPTDPVQSFFLLLGGAGIAEEALFRLLVLSFLWRVSGSAPVAVIAAAATFGAYHLSPLDSLYEQFWLFPVSQFLASVFTGVVWGITYVKRGYETCVLGHALGDWLTILVFAR